MTANEAKQYIFYYTVPVMRYAWPDDSPQIKFKVQNSLFGLYPLSLFICQYIVQQIKDITLKQIIFNWLLLPKHIHTFQDNKELMVYVSFLDKLQFPFHFYDFISEGFVLKMCDKQPNFTERLKGFMRLKGQIEITSKFKRYTCCAHTVPGP